MGTLVHILGTLYYPDLNPVGPSSMIGLCVVLAMTTLCSSFVPKWIRLAGLLISPALLMVPAYIYLTLRFADGDDLVALVLYLAFGFGISLMCLREKNVLHRIAGSAYSLLFGMAIVFVPSLMLSYDLFKVAWPGITLTLAFVPVWVIYLIATNCRDVRLLRLERNLCVACGYDLRGSVGRAQCPECGEAIENNLWLHEGRGRGVG